MIRNAESVTWARPNKGMKEHLLRVNAPNLWKNDLEHNNGFESISSTNFGNKAL